MSSLQRFNRTVMILDIIRHPTLHLKHDVSEPAFCSGVPVEPTQVGPVDSVNLLTPDTSSNANRRMPSSPVLCRVALVRIYVLRSVSPPSSG
jgi:hypothetical protein